MSDLGHNLDQDETPTAGEAAPAPRRSRRGAVVAIAVAAVAIAMIAAVTLDNTPGRTPSQAGPTADDSIARLDDALAAGIPVYLLVHSSA